MVNISVKDKKPKGFFFIDKNYLISYTLFDSCEEIKELWNIFYREIVVGENY
jgi:hypothetical protein